MAKKKPAPKKSSTKKSCPKKCSKKKCDTKKDCSLQIPTPEVPKTKSNYLYSLIKKTLGYE